MDWNNSMLLSIKAYNLQGVSCTFFFAQSEKGIEKFFYLWYNEFAKQTQ